MKDRHSCKIAPISIILLLYSTAAFSAELGGEDEIKITVNNPQFLTMDTNSASGSTLTPGAGATEVGKWMITTNGSFVVKFEPGAAPAGSYTPPDYIAFTKPDLDAGGTPVNGEFDELPTKFTVTGENISSMVVVQNSSAVALKGKNGEWSGDGKTYGSEIGQDGIALQVMDLETEPVAVLLTAEAEEIGERLDIQPGNYSGNIKITVIANQMDN
jgi:hypothetical protein